MKVFLFFMVLIFSSILYAQYDYECGMSPDDSITLPRGYQINPPQIGGKHAPAKTLNGAYVRIFFVFAQFTGDTKDASSTVWPLNQLPVWANSFIGTDINQAPFQVNTLSNYFYEMSNGQNIIIGYVYPELIFVESPSNEHYGLSNRKVLQKIDPHVNFQEFDQWNMMGTYQQTFNQTDNYVDAIYIIWRNMINPNYKWGGIAALGTSYTTNEGVIIANSVPTIGVTINAGGNSNYTFENKLGLLAHEYGHYLYGSAHNFENNYYPGMPDGSIQRGLGLMNANSGGGMIMNPQEKYLLGYTTYTDIFYDQSGPLPDFNSTGSVYRIPIPTHINGQPNTTPNEFFAIANHQKISPYELGSKKGIYIYHIKTNYYGHNHIDMLTAHELWQWQVVDWVPRPSGYGSPANWARYNQSPPELFPAINPLSVDRINGRNELKEVVYAQYPNQNYYWWDRYLDGNGNPNYGVVPQHSIPWLEGYNQIFSPWSNPPTFDKNRNPVYAAMEIINENNGSFNLQFYVGENNCLQTAPSKPQNIRIVATQDLHPNIIWENNLEPDIYQYRVLRSPFPNHSYTQIAVVNHNPFISHQNYIDYTVSLPPPGGVPGAVYYYKIVARDNSLLESVPSDYASVISSHYWWEKMSPGEDKNHKIVEYNLNDNFPNPFNPTTTINYSIKQDAFVTLKVYDILGSEVATLVSEMKAPGHYSVNFNASSVSGGLSSGVYIYRLTATSNDRILFTDTKRMLLMK